MQRVPCKYWFYFFAVQGFSFVVYQSLKWKLPILPLRHRYLFDYVLHRMPGKREAQKTSLLQPAKPLVANYWSMYRRQINPFSLMKVFPVPFGDFVAGDHWTPENLHWKQNFQRAIKINWSQHHFKQGVLLSKVFLGGMSQIFVVGLVIWQQTTKFEVRSKKAPILWESYLLLLYKKGSSCQLL